MNSVVNMEDAYLQREAELRFVKLIENMPDGMRSALDVGCGAGLYGKALSKKAEHVFGIDFSELLCKAASSTGCYENVVCDSIERLSAHFTQVDLILCVEVLEHLSDVQRKNAICDIHNLSPRYLVFTTPNPLSPHYRHDPTHIAQYTISSMLRELNSDGRYIYKLSALGFADCHLKKSRILRSLQPLSSAIPILSPTVAYVGTLR